jgi:hypothetical protein
MRRWQYGSAKLVKPIKKLTLKVQDGWPRYVSKRFGPEFFDVAGLERENGSWVIRMFAEESA